MNHSKALLLNSLLLFGLGVASASCGGPVDQNEEQLGDDNSALAIFQTYYAVRQDLRLCPAPECGGYFVRAVNESKTRCADGTFQAECYVAKINILRPPPPGPIQPAATSVTLGGNTGVAFALGSLSPSPTANVNAPVLNASQAWRAASRHAATGSTFSLALIPPASTTGHPSYSEFELNVDQKLTAAAIDLAGVGASQTDLQWAKELVRSGQLIASGKNLAADGTVIVGIIFVASQFYLPILVP